MQTPKSIPRSQSAHLNRLLASLPTKDYEQLRPHLEPITLQFKHTFYRANTPIDFVHFIKTGVGSLVNTMTNGDAAEVGTIGNEGIVGLPVIFGDRQTPTGAYMQVPGAGFRMAVTFFHEQIARSASLRTAMLHYACQSASNFDPRSASNFDPLEPRALAVALVPSELARVAETGRARVGT